MTWGSVNSTPERPAVSFEIISSLVESMGAVEVRSPSCYIPPKPLHSLHRVVVALNCLVLACEGSKRELTAIRIDTNLQKTSTTPNIHRTALTPVSLKSITSSSDSKPPTQPTAPPPPPLHPTLSHSSTSVLLLPPLLQERRTTSFVQVRENYSLPER